MTEQMTAPTTDTSADRKRWIALYTLCVGMLMIVLDTTVVNVALPSVQKDLNFTQTNLAWVVNAYLIAFGGLLLLAGRVGDLLGQRRMFLYGLVVFTAASVVCAASQTQEMLIAARFIQGGGGAFTSAVILGMIVTMFPEPREQAKAIGTYGFIAVGGAAAGLVIGGALTDAISWHWIFLINVPIGIATFVMARRLIEDRPGIGWSAGADVPGATLVTLGLMAGVYAILQASTKGWTSTETLGFGAISIVLIAGFIVRQAMIKNPLMPLRLFRSRNVSGANLVQALTVAGMFGIFFLGALYLQKIQHYSPLGVGMAFLPSTIITATMSLRFTDKLNMRYGPKKVLIPGLVALGVGLLLFARTPVDGNYVRDILPAMIIFGFGGGVAFPALMMTAMSGVEQSESGLASGLVNTSMQVGGAVGLAVLATLSTGRTADKVAAGAGQAEALNSGYHYAYLIGAALVLAAVVVAVAVIQAPKMPSPEEMAAAGGADEGFAPDGAPEPAYSEV